VTGRPAADASGPPKLIEHVAELRRHLGARRPVHRELEPDGLGLSTARVADGAVVAFDGTLESISDGVVVSGVLRVPWVGECRRCLGEASGVSEVDVREIFETHPTDGETFPLDGDHLDLGPMVHDTVLLALPLAPLCGPDCLGPAPDQFPAVATGDGSEATAADGPAEAPRDPRWAALDDLDL
jgi:uncharacterized protein